MRHSDARRCGAMWMERGAERRTACGAVGGLRVWCESVFVCAVECVRERGLIDIVLIHAYTNGLGIDLDEFGERVLRTAGNGYCAANCDIEIREFSAGKR